MRRTEFHAKKAFTEGLISSPDEADLWLALLEDRNLTSHAYVAVREVRVFGSRAVGRVRRASDLDLAIFTPGASGVEWAELCDALENARLIYELNVVHLERTANERLKEKIAREGVTIYPEDGAAALSREGHPS